MKVAVIGAGAMGSGIAQTFAQCGKIEKVYLRGRLVCSEGEITLEHSGRYVTRGKYALY